jgi:excisionase family DNA binding protein
VREVIFGRRISRASIHRLAREGLIPTVRVGRRMLFDEHLLRDWARAGGTGLPT